MTRISRPTGDYNIASRMKVLGKVVIKIALFRRKKDLRIDELMYEIAKTQKDLESAYQNFENVIDPDLIDSCIYEVNAIQHRYRFLLREAKKLSRFTSESC